MLTLLVVLGGCPKATPQPAEAAVGDPSPPSVPPVGTDPAPAGGPWSPTLRRQQHPLVGRIWDRDAARWVDPEEMVAALREADHVVVDVDMANVDHGRLSALVILQLRPVRVVDRATRPVPGLNEAIEAAGIPMVRPVKLTVGSDARPADPAVRARLAAITCGLESPEGLDTAARDHSTLNQWTADMLASAGHGSLAVAIDGLTLVDPVFTATLGDGVRTLQLVEVVEGAERPEDHGVSADYSWFTPRVNPYPDCDYFHAGFPPPAEGYRDVAVVSSTLSAGHVITTDDIAWMRIPEDYALPNGLEPAESLIGRTVATRILDGQWLREERLGPGGTPYPPRVPVQGVFHPSSGGDTVMVIVAARDLPPGTRIAEDDLYAVQIPPRYLPEGVFLHPGHVVGAVVCDPQVLANEFVRAEAIDNGEGCR